MYQRISPDRLISKSEAKTFYTSTVLLRMLCIRILLPTAFTWFVKGFGRVGWFLWKISSNKGGTLISLVSTSTTISSVDNQEYECTSPSTSRSFRSVTVSHRVFLSICLEEAIDSSVASESVNKKIFMLFRKSPNNKISVCLAAYIA